MKRNLLSMFAVAAGLLLATSCSTKQEEEVTTGGEAVVTFTAQLPTEANTTRAPQRTTNVTGIGDGLTANHLQYAVYEVNGDEWALVDKLSRDTTLVDRKTTVTLQLAYGKTYAVAFWADASDGKTPFIYTFNKENCNITADYTNATANQESYDAFYALKKFTVTGSTQETIKLTRPFARLNIGTADLTVAEEKGYKVTQAGIKVKIPNTLDLKDGTVSGEADVTFALADLPTAKFIVQSSKYKYLTMNYLLTSADKTSDNTVIISYDDASKLPARTFKNVPLQRNYRTNIYGNLLTSTNEFSIEVENGFDGNVTLPFFSVSESNYVVFSKGNLQYEQVAKKWSFAEHQYDMLGTANVTATDAATYSETWGYSITGTALADKIDLFSWNNDNGTFVDWGDELGEGYRTLTQSEWEYLLNTRTNAAQKKGVACIKWGDGASDYTNGLILLPDIWTLPAGVTFTSGYASSSNEPDYATYQQFTLAEWQKLETAGAVFLPASGERNVASLSLIQLQGYYWTSTRAGLPNTAYAVKISPNQLAPNNAGNISKGYAVRLVQGL